MATSWFTPADYVLKCVGPFRYLGATSQLEARLAFFLPSTDLISPNTSTPIRVSGIFSRVHS